MLGLCSRDWGVLRLVYLLSASSTEATEGGSTGVGGMRLWNMVAVVVLGEGTGGGCIWCTVFSL